VIVAIDGPAGAGKSTVARAVARALSYTYLDSGAMYRAVALASLRGDDDVAGLEIKLDNGRVCLGHEDVSHLIRTPEVSERASEVAADPAVREALVGKQRELLAKGNWVAEGRDIGTVVAPHAELKVYLTAAPEERARRRAAELGQPVEKVLADMQERDERDTTREHSPLRAADDAVEVDTTGLSIDDVVERIAELTRR
jgi:cytidylate kinase